MSRSGTRSEAIVVPETERDDAKYDGSYLAIKTADPNTNFQLVVAGAAPDP